MNGVENYYLCGKACKLGRVAPSTGDEDIFQEIKDLLSMSSDIHA
jgi:hypothetical protein